MSRLFDALQNARHEVAEKFTPQTTNPTIVTAPKLPGKSTRSEDSRFVNVLSALQKLSTRRDGCVVALMGLRGGEGTSTVSKELADFIVRQTYGKTLVLECRSDHLSREVKIHGVPHEKGQSTMQTVAGVPSDDEPQTSYACATLIAGTNAPHNKEYDDNLVEFGDQLASQYDWIILDCPPVMQHDYDHRFVQVADAAILIVESERSEVNDLGRAADKIKLAGAKLLGVVLNKRSNYTPSMLRRLLMRFGIN